MDIRASLAAQAYSAGKKAAVPGQSGSGLGAAIGDFAATLAKGEQVAKAAMNGGADMQSLVEALSQSQLAIETAVTVRDKVVEAYQEILRMQV